MHMTVYTIKNWGKVFENFRSRELKEPKYVCWPVRLDSEGLGMLLETPDGLQAFGVFSVLVQLAAKCPVRGTLEDERGPWTVDRISKHLRIPRDILTRAFALLSSTEIGWLTCKGGESLQRQEERQTDDTSMQDRAPSMTGRCAVDAIPCAVTTAHGASIHPSYPSCIPKTNTPPVAARRPPRGVSDSLSWSLESGFTGIPLEQRKAWELAYPSVNLEAELAKAHAWLIANPTRAGKRKWARFIGNWLSRAHEQPKAPQQRLGFESDVERTRRMLTEGSAA